MHSTIRPLILVSIACFSPLAFGQGSPSGAATAAPQATAAAPTDPQILAIAAAANQGEIDAAKLATKQAKDKAVQSFAKMMIDDHSAVLKKADALAKKLGVAPASSPASQALEASNQKSLEMLKPLKKQAFDKLYIDQQVIAHQEVLNDLDKTLIPNARNPELKSLLQSVRPKVAMHLDEAKKIQGNLSGKA